MCIVVTCCILISIECSRLWTCRHFIILGKSNCFTKMHIVVFAWLTSFGYLEWRGLHTCAEGLLLYQGMQKFNNIPYKSLIAFHSKVCKLYLYLLKFTKERKRRKGKQGALIHMDSYFPILGYVVNLMGIILIYYLWYKVCFPVCLAWLVVNSCCLLIQAPIDLCLELNFLSLQR